MFAGDDCFGLGNFREIPWYFILGTRVLRLIYGMVIEGSLMPDGVMGKWKYTGSVGYNKLLAVGHFPNFIHQIFVKDKTEINPRSHKI